MSRKGHNHGNQPGGGKDKGGKSIPLDVMRSEFAKLHSLMKQRFGKDPSYEEVKTSNDNYVIENMNEAFNKLKGRGGLRKGLMLLGEKTASTLDSGFSSLKDPMAKAHVVAWALADAIDVGTLTSALSLGWNAMKPFYEIFKPRIHDWLAQNMSKAHGWLTKLGLHSDDPPVSLGTGIQIKSQPGGSFSGYSTYGNGITGPCTTDGVHIPYIQCVLSPVNYPCRVPGKASSAKTALVNQTQSIPNVVLNTSGNAQIQICLDQIFAQGTGALGNAYTAVCNNALFNPSTGANGAAISYALSPWFSYAGNVNTWRYVGCVITFRNLTSVLNTSGQIEVGYWQDKPASGYQIGAVVPQSVIQTADYYQVESMKNGVVSVMFVPDATSNDIQLTSVTGLSNTQVVVALFTGGQGGTTPGQIAITIDTVYEYLPTTAFAGQVERHSPPIAPMSVDAISAMIQMKEGIMHMRRDQLLDLAGKVSGWTPKFDDIMREVDGLIVKKRDFQAVLASGMNDDESFGDDEEIISR